ncbi:hypothetical protein [Endomicrobium proavitum]|uniref:Uncharacterized protein n=1 Tax=Endomicrobium proavitum TaxID=1408281 RepID=A0A0G3WHF3_9BACT|nr:hypothetical protein [Endomicrobium proavitum]AKL98056.1 exported protein of unknown function [Endomicrobium proavitum]
MRKFFITLSLIVVATANVFAAQSENYGSNIYGLFSENFNGAKLSLSAWTGQLNAGAPTETPNLDDRDRAEVYVFGGGSVFMTTVVYTSAHNTLGGQSLDGIWFWRIIASTGGNTWDGFSVTLVSSSSVTPIPDAPRLMSAYKDGSIEFYARSAHPTVENFNVGITLLYNDSVSVDYVDTLGSYGFTADGTWQKVIFPLTSANLGATVDMDTWRIKNIFVLLKNNSTGTLEIDQIIWKKASAPVTFDFKLMDTATGLASANSYISWNENKIAQGWQVSDEYLELNLDSLPNDNSSWGIQIYTDATSSNAQANPKYTGVLNSSTNFGLISTSDTTKMIPMAWRVTDKVLPYVGTNNVAMEDYNQTKNISLFLGGYDGPDYVAPGLYDSGNPGTGSQFYHCWFFMKDKSQFGMAADVYNGMDYLRVWDKRGFHAAAGETFYGMSAGGMQNMRIAPKLYFAVDMNQAFAPQTYENNSIIIQLFYE